MNRQQAPHIFAAVAFMVAGGVVAKFLDGTAGAAIVAVGSLLVGRMMQQPAAFRKDGDGPS